MPLFMPSHLLSTYYMPSTIPGEDIVNKTGPQKKNCALVELIFWWEETNNKGCEMAPWRKLKHSWTLGHNRGVLVAILNRVVMEGLTEVSFEQELKLTLNYETYMRYVK